MEPGKTPRFYADEMTDELLGMEHSSAPEERFAFQRSWIHPQDAELFQEFAGQLEQTPAEIV